jgi:hypothetical protein
MDESTVSNAAAVPPLNESQRRALSIALAGVERDAALALELLRKPPRDKLLTRYVEPLLAPHDGSPEAALSAIEQKLKQIVNDLRLEFHTESVARGIVSALLLDTVALEEVNANRLRGYGPVDAAAARYLDRELPELRAALDRLIDTLAPTGFAEHTQQP